MSVNLFGGEFGVILMIAISLFIVLFAAVLVYQIRLIRKLSFLKANDIKPSKAQDNESANAQDPVLVAVITAAINQYKNQKFTKVI